MRNGLCLGVITALILSARSVDAQVSYFYRGPAPAYSALVRAAFGALLSRPVFLFTPQADGGGSDGGGSDGSSGDSSSSDGTGDSADSGDAAAAAAAEAADAAAAQDASAVSDPTTDPGIAPTTEEAMTPELSAIMSIPTTDPRDGEAPISGSTNGDVVGGAGGSVPPTGGAPPAAPVDLEIDAVIVSGANSPWGAVQRAPGVRNITVEEALSRWGRHPCPVSRRRVADNRTGCASFRTSGFWMVR